MPSIFILCRPPATPPACPSTICMDLFHDNFILSLAPERWIGQQGDGINAGLINLLPLCEAHMTPYLMGEG